MIILILISIQGYSQNLLGYNKEYVIDKKGDPTSVDITNDSIMLIIYVHLDSNLEEGYRFNHNICCTYYIMNTNNMLDNYVNILNNNYIRIDSTIWTYKFRNFTSIAELESNISRGRFLLTFFRKYDN